MKQTSGRKAKAHTKVAEAESPRDRKSNTGMSGLPKKGGHGGKFTWAGHDEMGFADGVAVDVKDPNFEDPAEVDLSP